MNQVTVELYGIPRARAGVSSTHAHGSTLGEVLLDMAARYPSLAAACLEGPSLKSGFIANLGGQRFVSDPTTQLADGDAILILSLDAGG